MTTSTRPPTSSERAQLEQLRDLWVKLEALESVVRTRKICLFRPLPNGKQGAATAALNESYLVLVLGSNRSGKSAWGVCEAIAHSLGYRPWLPEDHPHRIVRLPNGDPIPVPNVGRILAQDFQQAIQQNIWPLIQEWAPTGMYTVRRDNRGIPVQLNWSNGSVVYFMSNDQDNMVFEGTKGHWAWIDEPPEYAKYIGLRRGLVDFDGHMWMTMTPLAQAWIADVIYSRANESGNKVRCFRFSIWDNCKDRGGYLSREAINEFLQNLREDEREAREHGNFLHLAGRVYKQWEPEAPFWVSPRRLPDHWPRVCVIDPHPRKPVAVLWAALDPDNRVFVYRDLFDSRLRTISEVAEKIKELEGWTCREKPNGERVWYRGETAEPVVYRIIDSSSKEQERTSGESTWQRFAEEGLTCQLAQKRNAQAGYDAIHEALRLKYEWSQPALIVFNNCRHVKENFLKFCYDDWQTDKQRDLKGEKQEVRKYYDDFIDCLRYIYQNGVTFQGLRAAMRADDRDAFESDHTQHNGMRMLPGTQAPRTRREREQWPTSSRYPNLQGSSLRETASLSTINRSLRLRNPT